MTLLFYYLAPLQNSILLSRLICRIRWLICGITFCRERFDWRTTCCTAVQGKMDSWIDDFQAKSNSWIAFLERSSKKIDAYKQEISY